MLMWNVVSVIERRQGLEGSRKEERGRGDSLFFLKKKAIDSMGNSVRYSSVF